MADTRCITANRLAEESQAIQRRGRNLVLLLGLPVALGAFFVHPLVGLRPRAFAPHPPGACGGFAGASRGPAAPGCPKCGSAMVKRKARQGASAGQQFWGCSQYPACRGTRALQ